MSGDLVRLPPQALDSEQATLGSALISRRAADSLLTALQEDDFYLLAHRRVYAAIAALALEGVVPDVLTVSEELARRGWSEGVGGLDYITALADSVPTAAHVEDYARTVKRQAVMRRLIDAAQQIDALAYGSLEPEEAVAAAESLVFAAGESRRSAEFHPALEIVIQVVGELCEETDNYVTTGFGELDFRLGGGLEPTMLYLLAGRSGMGKTAMLAGLVNAAAARGVPVGVFSLEMSRERLIRRHLSMQARMPIASLKLARTSDEAQRRLAAAAGAVGDLPIHIYDQRESPLSVIRSHARRLRRRENIGLFLVDYLQLVTPEHGRKDDVRHFSAVAEGLKSMARELEVPVVALSQLSRDVERSENKRPQLHHLRESGGLEQSADGVMLLFNPNYYKRMNGEEIPGPDPAEVILAKNRDGSTSVVDLMFYPDLMLFREPGDLSDGDAPPPRTSHWSVE